MADHDVRFKIPQRKLERADVTFTVKKDKQLFGRLFVSEGGLEWLPHKKKKKRSGIKITWSDFARFAQTKRKVK